MKWIAIAITVSKKTILFPYGLLINRRTKMKVFRIKAICDFIEDVEVIAESKEQAEELLFSGDYKVLNETYENQEIISIKERGDED